MAQKATRCPSCNHEFFVTKQDQQRGSVNCPECETLVKVSEPRSPWLLLASAAAVIVIGLVVAALLVGLQATGIMPKEMEQPGEEQSELMEIDPLAPGEQDEPNPTGAEAGS